MNNMKFLLYLSYLLVLGPLLLLVVWTFAGLWAWPALFPETLSLRGFQELFGGYSGAMGILGSSMLLSCAVALLAVAVSLPAARALVMYDFRGRSLLNFLILLPVIIPTTAFAMGIHSLFLRVGLSDTVPGVVLVHVILCLPYTVRLLTAATEAAGDRLEAQARVLGASPAQVFVHVTLPMVLPGMMSAACMAFIVSFSLYFVTLLVGGGNVMTYSLLMLPYVQSGDRTVASAYGLLFILASLLVFVGLEKLVRRCYDIQSIFYFG